MTESTTKNSLQIVLENVKNRWSCRVFLDKPIPKSDVEILVDAANCAPSPMNTQPWEFIALAGKPLMQFRAAVAEWLQTPLQKPDNEISILPDGDYYSSLPKHLANRKREHLQRTADTVAALGMSLKEVYNFTFFCYNAPVAIVVVGDAVKRDRHGLEVHQALAAAIQNILLVAHAMGYGTCWIGDIMRFGKRLTEHFGLDSMKEVVGAVALGQPDMDSRVNRERAPKRPVRVEWRGF